MNTINVGAEQTEGSAKQRMTLLIGAYHASLDHPLFGLGPGGWLEVAEAYTGDSHNPHNIYLVLSSETGIPGLCIYLFVVIFTYVRVSRMTAAALKRGDREWARLGSALITCIFGLLSAMTFLNRPFNEYLWAWLAIANAMPAISARDARRSARAAARGSAGAAEPRRRGPSPGRGRSRWIRPRGVEPKPGDGPAHPGSNEGVTGPATGPGTPADGTRRTP
jgi:hypothetical protein